MGKRSKVVDTGSGVEFIPLPVKQRKCLKCLKSFKSEGISNRICNGCNRDNTNLFVKKEIPVEIHRKLKHEEFD